MSDQYVTTISGPAGGSMTAASPNAIAKPDKPADKPKRERIRGKLKVALDAIVWEGMCWDDAARKANFTVQAMRKALERAHVIAYLKAQKQVFRASVSSQNIHVLADLRDSSGNAMARLGAIKVLENIDEDRPIASQQSAPGVVIVIGAPAAVTPVQRSIDVKANVINGSGPDEG